MLSRDPFFLKKNREIAAMVRHLTELSNTSVHSERSKLCQTKSKALLHQQTLKHTEINLPEIIINTSSNFFSGVTSLFKGEKFMDARKISRLLLPARAKENAPNVKAGCPITPLKIIDAKVLNLQFLEYESLLVQQKGGKLRKRFLKHHADRSYREGPYRMKETFFNRLEVDGCHSYRAREKKITQSLDLIRRRKLQELQSIRRSDQNAKLYNSARDGQKASQSLVSLVRTVNEEQIKQRLRKVKKSADQSLPRLYREKVL